MRARAVLLMAGWLAIYAGACASFMTPPEPPLPYRQAEDAFRLGDYERAVRGYRVFVGTQEQEELIPRAYYKMALAEFRRGRYEACLEVLDELEKRFPDERWAQVPALRGDAEEGRGNLISALRWWEIAWQSAENDAQAALQRRLADGIRQMPADVLQAAKKVLSTAEAHALVEARLKELASGATAPGARPAAGVPAPGVPLGTAVRIAALLPLSGPYAAYGQRSLNGLRLALGADANRWVVHDTRGESQVARAALDRLAADPTVVAVIGPLRSEVAEHLAPLAERAGLPMLALAQRAGPSGRFVAQLALTPERQAGAIADYTVTEMGIGRFGIIHPADTYGNALADAFRHAVTRRGAAVVGALAYAPSAREFGVEALTVQKWRAEDGVQAIYAPATAETAVLLAGAVRQAVPDLVLLGSNGWNDLDRLSDAGGVVDGAVFVDGFFAGSGRAATQKFVAGYQAAHGGLPGILEAQAYDAATLLQQLLAAGVRARGEVMPRLRGLGAFDGASGRLWFRPDGIERDVFLLRFSGGVIQELIPRARRRAVVGGAPPPGPRP
jgi:ABC-type branched-subunit amino acid transport system substrate-binding protein